MAAVLSAIEMEFASHEVVLFRHVCSP